MKSRPARIPPAAQIDSVPVLLQNQQRAVPVDCVLLERTASAILASARTGEAELSLVLVSDRRMRALNRRYRKKDRPTDVLAFPLLERCSPKSSQLRKPSAERRSAAPAASLAAKSRLSSVQIGSRLRTPQALASGNSGKSPQRKPPALPPALLGDVVISMPTAKRQAAEHGHGLYEEMSRLLVHGVLHLLGYDHERGPREAARMARKERTILRAIRSS
jgi:rRNA maturation RNase YbeY